MRTPQTCGQVRFWKKLLWLRFRSILFGSLAVLAGCVTLDAKPTHDFLGSADKGLLAVSARHTNVRWVDLFYRNIKTRAGGFLRTYSKTIPMDWENPTGRLIVAELPVGAYEIYRWESTDGLVFFNSADSFSIRFEVVPGRATYIGGILIELGTENYPGNLLSKKRKVGFAVRDESERDLKIFLNRYQKLTINDVRVNITSIDEICGAELAVKC